MRRKSKVHEVEIGEIIESIPDINRNQEDDAEYQKNKGKWDSNRDLVMIKMIWYNQKPVE